MALNHMEMCAGDGTSAADALPEDALCASEERLRAHIDNSPLAIVEFDPQLTVIRWSKGAQRLFGWTAEEMIGRRVPELRWVHEADAESVARETDRLLSGAVTRTHTSNRNYRKDGSVVHCEWYGSAIRDSRGRLVSILSQVLDVTDRQRAEEALRESEAALRALFDANGAFMSIVELEEDDFVFLLVNADAARFFGRAVPAVVGRRGRELGLPRETVVEWLEHFRRCRDARSSIAFDCSIPSGGARAWFHGTVSPMPGGPSGQPRFAIVAVDLTARRRMEEEIREAGERFRTLVDGRSPQRRQAQGAEFTVLLPLETSPATPETGKSPLALPSLDVLLVEDNRDAGETLADILQLQGHRTRLALDGASAGAAFREAAPDVLVCDIGLPDVSGYDLVRSLRRLETGRRMFAVALSGYAQPEDVERAREAGFDAHLSKPPALDELEALLARAAAARGHPGPARPGSDS